MERSIMMTADGSHTIFMNGMNEPYHSTHGALRESMHVFINEGLQRTEQTHLRILEVGFGTGLNALLTLKESISRNLNIYYHAVEKYPVKESEFTLLNYEKVIDSCPEGVFLRMHNCPWGKHVKMTNHFTLYKENSDFRSMNLPSHFNLVYFDAFSPDKQPELWTEDIFGTINKVSDPGAILVTYSSKGAVRRTLTACGFSVHKVTGPPGKREMIRAVKR